MRNSKSRGRRKANTQKKRGFATKGKYSQQLGRAHRGVKKKGPIPLRVLAVLALPLIITHVINALLFSAFYSIVSLVFIILYIIAGYIGGNYWFADHPKFPRKAKPRAVQEGAACGLTLGVINLIIMFISVVFFSIVSLGTGAIFASLTFLFCLPTEIGSSLIMGALGGWLSERSR
jgi:hypothetical protein